MDDWMNRKWERDDLVWRQNAILGVWVFIGAVMAVLAIAATI